MSQQPHAKPCNVALFITCLTDQFYPRVGIAVTKILERLGCRVFFPPAQTCCGQPFFNNGYFDEARPLALRMLGETLFDADTGVSNEAVTALGKMGPAAKAAVPELIYALSEELSRTVSEIDGVISARVHVVLPENDPLRRDLVPSSASVFIRHDTSLPVNDLKQLVGLEASFVGIVTKAEHRIAKSGKPFGSFSLEDHNGSHDFMLFSEDYMKYKLYLQTGTLLFVKNTVVHAAFGVSNFVESNGVNNLLTQNPPFEQANSITFQSVGPGSNLPGSTRDDGFVGFPTGCTLALAQAFSAQCFSGVTIHAFDPKLRPAVHYQWNLGVQHQFGNATTVQVGSTNRSSSRT